ncbi:MAG: DUF4145 domain-containing protein [Planctomycetota bacterium]
MPSHNSAMNQVRTSVCRQCQKAHVWHLEEMVYPRRGSVPQPNENTLEEVRKLYEEAASIANHSPRAAAALLRLAIKHLRKHLGCPGENINDDIALLVQKGLPDIVQQSLDIVRVVGNNALHPGTIDVDSPDTVGKLFELNNVIVEYTISLPKRVGALYGALPGGAKNAIAKRDGK